MTPAHLSILLALLDTLIPQDDYPSATQNQVHRYIDGILASEHQGKHAQVAAGLTALAATGFVELPLDARADALHAFAREGHQAFVQFMATLANEGYYADRTNGGNPEHASWDMIGFRPQTKRPFTPPDLSITPHTIDQIEREYDTIVIGAGAGGGVAASVLAKAGRTVLVLERGDWLSFENSTFDHLRNHRLQRYGHNTGPDLQGHPRVVQHADGSAQTVRPHEGGYGNNAMTLGGGTRVYGAQAWRFHPDDFRMASRYGIPQDSSLADWPITYDDLEPYYDRAEWELGVCGDATEHRCIGPRSRNFPMPPITRDAQYALLKPAAERLGWAAGPPALLINSTVYNGRPPCARCGMCVGFACPSESKNGSHNTAIPAALATGRCHLLTAALADRLLTEDNRVVGVRFWLDSDQPTVHEVRARNVVLACGAIESARLLLHSPTDREPRGIGNRHDQVGRHLQSHVYGGAFAQFAEPVHECEGPGVSIATLDHLHGHDGIIGGGLLANEFTKLPLSFYNSSLPPGTPRWGLELKQAMTHQYRRTLQCYGPIQDVPNPRSRVTLDPIVTDKFGVPVARLHGTVHPESLRTSNHMRKFAERWLKEAGATRVWSHETRGGGPCGGQHQAGTCRMGVDPKTSVTDPTGRVHGHGNLFVCDGSVHVTNGGVNPVLTIFALAYRTADRIVADA